MTIIRHLPGLLLNLRQGEGVDISLPLCQRFILLILSWE
ncbi:hypothetical protein SAMN00120144_3726 [Hymenobacter roseosalivarius DSM 11622]|uniref:Uncharacterized protein n=1 Tax=Hymenobacter roseosalivarius DSM 11622 TaxID=645990 RepID=A0A1W1VAU4_9BACT|nr:hypothetical protein SAMN00120144_3726 [Hymenobacter roseosalivarius DSM 11622]